jgi:hypothetical protein
MALVDSALRRLGIEPAERSIFGHAGLCLMLLGATAFALLNSSETLFLKRVGVEKLPWALLASSALLVVTTGLLGGFLARVDRPPWLPRVLLMLALALAPFYWLLRSGDSPIIFGAYILVSRQVLALGLLSFWLALSDRVTGRQAKRLFAPLASGVTLGGIIGSFASGPIANLISVEGLVLLGTALLLGSAFFALRLDRSRAGRRLELPAPSAGRSAGKQVAPSFGGLMRESRLFRLLSISLLCGGLLSPVLYFEFSVVADASTRGPDAEQALLGLYSQFRGWLNVAMLLMQLWISNRLFRGIGLPLCLALWPVTYMIGFGSLAVHPSLIVGVAALGGGRLVEDGVGDSALRVLYSLFPERTRAKAAGLLQGPVTRIGGVIGNGSVLVSLASGLTRTIPLVAIGVTFVWLAAALRLWRRYPTLLLQASSDQGLSASEAERATLLDRGTVRALAPGLVTGDLATCRATLDLIRDAAPPLVAEVLVEALPDAPDTHIPVLAEALQRLMLSGVADGPYADATTRGLREALAGRRDWQTEIRAELLQSYARMSATVEGTERAASAELLRRALGDHAPAVRLVAIAELHRRGSPPPGAPDLDATLRGALAAPDVLLRRVARDELRAMLLAAEPDETLARGLAALAGRLSARADRAAVADALVDVARHHGQAAQGCAPQLLRYANDRDPLVRAAVLRYSGHAGLDAQANRLVAGLRARSVEEERAAREGLVALGPAAAAPLLASDALGGGRSRDAVMEVLGELDLEPGLLESLYGRQLEGVRHALLARRALAGEERAGLVLRQLDDRVREGLGTLLSIVSALEADERIADLERRMRRAPDERGRDILLEALEATLPASVRGELVPLLEISLHSEAVSAAAAQAGLGAAIPSAEQGWTMLLEGDDALTRRLAQSFAPSAVEERAQIGDAWDVLDPMEVAMRLQTVPAFDRLSTRHLIGLAEVLELVRFAAGELVFAAGDEGDGLYFVLEGEVALVDGAGAEERFGPGRFFGELSTLDGIPRAATARARDAVQLLRLEREELLALMEEAPALGIGISQYLSHRLRRSSEQGEEA